MPKAIGIVFALIFGGIGVTVLIFMWGAPFDDFHSPPLFFRIFASFIAIGFVAFAAGMIHAVARGDTFVKNHPNDVERISSAPDRPAPGRYACPHCAAPLSKDAEVSPLGDTKCPHCGAWYNIHGRKA